MTHRSGAFLKRQSRFWWTLWNMLQRYVSASNKELHRHRYHTNCIYFSFITVHSRSLILNFDTSWKPTRNFVLVINTYIPSRIIFKLWCIICQIISFDKGVPLVNALSLMHSFSAITLNIAISHILPKSRFWGFIFIIDSMGLPPTSLM